MVDYNNPYEDGQEGWDQGYSDQQYLNQQYSGTNIPRTTYIDQNALTSLATNAGPSYPYLSTGSASHDDPGSYIPPHPGLATQPWDMGPYQAWTTSSLPPTTTYTMTSGAFSDPTATGFPDIAPLSDSLPPIPEQQLVEYQSGYDYSYGQAPPREPSSSPSQLRCDICNENFANQKNWDRHLTSEKHLSNVGEDDPDVPKYRCACTYSVARKDNYRRHLKHCAFRIDFAYVCTCGEHTQDKEYHEQHIDNCGRKRHKKGHKW
ncbi:uncharacterized protein QC764_703393 [Podospora pseudoanserina]|uniref:C2H2-type domain-containing protein n=1 Tax=Podospora pseudoanserina TaxID=2609844 RepID=A0ABR0HIP3_9PEZI|nr:hypothetical protein QC764_703393 [Podospora pseudoanserina]